MESIVRDIRVALRSLAHQPVFTLVAVVSLGLGIGANGAIFSTVNALLLKPPTAVQRADELVRIYQLRRSFDYPLGISVPDFTDIETATDDLLTGLAGHTIAQFGLAVGDETPRVEGGLAVYGDYFGTLGVEPALGRFFGTAEEASREPVAVLSDELWRSRFGADPAVVGRSIRLDGRSFTVVAVAPPGFFGTEAIFAPALWVPATVMPWIESLLDERDGDLLRVTARLGPDVRLEQLEAALATLTTRLAADYPDSHEAATILAMPDSEARVEAGLGGPLKLVAALLLGLVAFVLLIACANVANLLLARASQRRRELSLRVAVGASRSRLVRHLFTESLLIAIGGGALGAALAVWTSSRLEGIDAPPGLPLRLELSPDLRVYLFTGAVALLSAVVFGLGPAIRAAGADPATGLREARIGSPGGRRLRLGSALVIGQVSLSLVLLIGAGLFVRSLREAERVDLGFDPEGVSSFTVDLDMIRRDEAQGRVFWEAALTRMRDIPGVESASAVRWMPMDWSSSGLELGVGRDLGEGIGDELIVLGSWVAPDYFETVRTPILTGRPFDEHDDADAPRVIIINQALSDRVWPGQSPLGRQLRLEGRDGEPAEVVGVVATGKYRLLGEAPRPYVFLPLRQSYRAQASFLLRSHRPPAEVLQDAIAEVARMEPDLAVLNPGLVGATIASRALGPIRLIASLAGSFGLIGLVLAATGLYGILAFSAAQRSREIGLRMALGARSGQILGSFLRQGLGLTGIGVALGLAIGAAASRLLGSLLVGISAGDPTTWIAVVLTLTGVAALASLLPAVRAARIDPVRTLKAD